jgi:hypothetical protein
MKATSDQSVLDQSHKNQNDIDPTIRDLNIFCNEAILSVWKLDINEISFNIRRTNLYLKHLEVHLLKIEDNTEFLT